MVPRLERVSPWEIETFVASSTALNPLPTLRTKKPWLNLVPSSHELMMPDTILVSCDGMLNKKRV